MLSPRSWENKNLLTGTYFKLVVDRRSLTFDKKFKNEVEMEKPTMAK